MESKKKKKKVLMNLGAGQTSRMDLRRQGGGSVSWDEVRKLHRHIYTTKCKIASGKQPHNTGRSARCFVTTCRGAIGRVGGRCKREGIRGYTYAYS